MRCLIRSIMPSLDGGTNAILALLTGHALYDTRDGWVKGAKGNQASHEIDAQRRVKLSEAFGGV